MASEQHDEYAGGAVPLSRADIEEMLRLGELQVRARNLQRCDLSYLDLQGADLQGTNLRGANLRGTNLSRADLQGADLSDADLDGADLTRAWLGQAGGEHVKLVRTRFSYALLRNLDLRNFDLGELNLYHADLSGSDLRGASLRGADLRGADLSTALLHGPELQGAILYRGAFLRDRGQQTGWEETNRLRAAVRPAQPPARVSPAAQRPAWAPDPSATGSFEALRKRPAWTLPAAEVERVTPIPEAAAWEEQTGEAEVRNPLTDREAYLFGVQVLLHGAQPAQIRQLFPQGFSFERSRQLFENWLRQAGTTYSEREVQALWIGFAQRICEYYFEGANDV